MIVCIKPLALLLFQPLTQELVNMEFDPDPEPRIIVVEKLNDDLLEPLLDDHASKDDEAFKHDMLNAPEAEVNNLGPHKEAVSGSDLPLDIFSQYSTWDLLMARAGSSLTSEALKTIFDETEVILEELKVIIDQYLEPADSQANLVSSRGRRIKPKGQSASETIEMGPILSSLASDGATKCWRLKSGAETDLCLEEPLKPAKKPLVEKVKVPNSPTKGQKRPGKPKPASEQPPLKRGKGRPRVQEPVEFKYHRYEGEFYCDFPGCESVIRPFANKAEFERHYSASHVLPEHFVVKCTQCSETFASAFLRDLHTESSHEKNPTRILRSDFMTVSR